MKILLISSAESPHTVKWANALQVKGHNITVFSFTPRKGDENYHPDIALIEHYQTAKAANLWGYCQAWLALLLLHLRQRFDLVQANYITTYGVLAAFIPFTTRIMNVWGSDILIRPKRSRLAYLVVKLSLWRSHMMISSSDFLARASLRYISRPAFVVPFGVTMVQDQQPQPAMTKADDEIWLVTPKWLKQTYGQDFIIQLLPQLVSAHPGKRIRYIMTGDGPDQAKFEACVAAAGMIEHVRFTGRLNQQEMFALMQQCDVALFPSRSESFGVAVLECSMLGIPVIANDLGGFPEVIQSERSGLLVAAADETAWLAAINRLIRYPKQAKAMGAAGQIFVEERFQFADCLEWLETIYRHAKRLKRFKHCSCVVPFSPIAAENYPRTLAVFPFPQTAAISAKHIRACLLGGAGERRGWRVIQGNKSDRIGQLLKSYLQALDSGRWPAIYFESNSTPLAREYIKQKSSRLIKYTSYLLRPKKFVHDYWLLQAFKAAGSPIAIYVRDAHQLFATYAKVVSKKVALLSKLSFAHELRTIKKLADVIYVPSAPFADLINFHNTQVLPPGCSSEVIKTPAYQSVHFSYWGGLGHVYQFTDYLNEIEGITNIADKLSFYVRRADFEQLTPPAQQQLAALAKINTEKSREEIIHSTSGSVGLCVFDDIPYLRYASPVKFWDYISANCPVIVSANLPVAALVEEHNIGWVVDNQAGFKQLVEQLIKMPDLIRDKREQLAQFKHEHSYDKRVLAIDEELHHE